MTTGSSLAPKGLTLAQRIIKATTVPAQLELIDYCEALLRNDPRLAGLPSPDTPYSDEEETEAVEPPDLVQYEDALRAVCYLAAGPRKACPAECRDCHKNNLLVQLAYGKNHAGYWYIHCTV